MRRQVTVTVADSHAGAVADVAELLARAGMEVAQVLAAIGVITGAVDDELRAAIEAVPGVAAVQEQSDFQLAPPDADVQ